MKANTNDDGNEKANGDLEASDQEFKGVCYTGISLVVFAIAIIGLTVFFTGERIMGYSFPGLGISLAS